MTRLERKKRNDISFINKGEISDLIDNVIKQKWRINDVEYDYFCDILTDKELDLLLNDDLDILNIKNAITMVNDKLKQYYENTNP